jgi:two-component system, OmpR family, phosphate regulon sensor histidine kinase PhoR
VTSTWLIALSVLLSGSMVTTWILWRELCRIRNDTRRLAEETRISTGGKGPAVVREIYHQLRRIEHRQREMAQLVADEDLSLRAILGSMSEGVLVANSDLTVRLVNERLQRMFSFSRVPVGRTILEVFRNHLLHQMAQRTVETNQPQEYEIPVDIRDGDKFVPKHFQVTSVSLHRPKQGGSAGILVVFHDVTQIRSLEAVRKDFVANVSHELRTPLSILTGYLETLIESSPDAATRRRFLAIMHKHAQRLNLLVDDLLELARLESREPHLNWERFQLQSCIEKVLEKSEPMIQASGAVVETRIAPGLPSIEADQVKIEQAIFNLLDNALKYGGKSEPRVLIEVDFTPVEVVLKVKDNGPGIPLSDQPHIFERFYRVHKDRSRDAGGTGLGLSIVKHTAQSHGGNVELASSPGEGATFIIRLPRVDGER